MCICVCVKQVLYLSMHVFHTLFVPVYMCSNQYIFQYVRLPLLLNPTLVPHSPTCKHVCSMSELCKFNLPVYRHLSAELNPFLTGSYYYLLNDYTQICSIYFSSEI